MNLEVDLPRSLSPAELDRRLARGFFRSGPILFRARLLHPDNELRELIHLRVRLDVDPPSKSRRRVLRRNRARFRTTVEPAYVTPDHQRLYDLSRRRFVGFVAEDLDVLALGEWSDVFDTRQVCVYDGDRLVAVSYFDLGKRSVASILGLHDPGYSKMSLGIYTMLEEMRFARERGARWYYPGYIIPGLAGFEYKTRLGAIQYLAPNGRWRDRSRPPQPSGAVAAATGRIEAMAAALEAQGVPCERKVYPAFWLGYLRTGHLLGSWHLRCSRTDGRRLVVEHVPDEDRFVAAWVRAVPELDAFELFVPNEVMEATCERSALRYVDVIAQGREIGPVARAVARATKAAR